MPPRKKVVGGAASTSAAAATPDGDEDGPGGIDQYELPKSVIARLAKSAVPPEVKLQKEVPLALVKGSTVFINYLAALSHDLAQEKNTKTIAANHVLEAVKQLGWEDGGELSKHLKKELKAFRKIAEAKKNGTYVAPKPKPKPVPSKPKASTSASASTSTSTEAPSEQQEPEVREEPQELAAAEEEEDSTTTLLKDDRPNLDEANQYPDEEMGDPGEEDGVEEYVEEEDEDEVLSEGGSEGVEEPVGAGDGLESDDSGQE
ncbi:hypothetical protein JCM5353_000260 [Sporobolomyces roseus]